MFRRTALIAALAHASVSAATFRASTAAELEKAAARLEPGDVLEVAGGSYRGQITLRSSGTPERPVIVRGVGEPRPAIVTSGGVRGGAALRVWSSHCVIEHLEITANRDAATGRGIYVVADGVTIRDCAVHDVAGQGIQSSDTSGALTLDRVEVFRCGSGMYAHQIYVATDNARFPRAVFRMSECYVHDGLGGNNVKSRAGRTELVGNWIEGAAFHELDLIGADPKGQQAPPGAVREDADIAGNVLRKRAGSRGAFARLGTDTTGASDGRYRFLHNTFVADADCRGPLTIFRTAAVQSLEVFNTVIDSPAAKVRLIDGAPGATTGAANWITARAADVPASWTGTLRGDDPGFRDVAALDFRPRAGSPLVGAGTPDARSPFDFPEPAEASLQPRTPSQPAQTRAKAERPEIGAFARP